GRQRRAGGARVRRRRDPIRVFGRHHVDALARVFAEPAKFAARNRNPRRAWVGARDAEVQRPQIGAAEGAVEVATGEPGQPRVADDVAAEDRAAGRLLAAAAVGILEDGFGQTRFRRRRWAEPLAFGPAEVGAPEGRRVGFAGRPADVDLLPGA